MSQFEEYEMTDKQADTSRNDLIDLIIEKVKRIIQDPNIAQALITEVEKLKH